MKRSEVVGSVTCFSRRVLEPPTCSGFPPWPKDPSMLRVFVSIRTLPDTCFPAHVVRDDEVPSRPITVLLVDPRATREEGTLWCLDNLSKAERDYCTAGYGQTPDQIDPDFLEGTCLQWVPEALRLPWEPAWQGFANIRAIA